jgi:lactate dehydrogenase-like 2-hydroxyacid dehydrogenase
MSAPSKNPLPPGSVIGVLGNGQLGRMMALAAAPLDYRVHIYDPSPGPATLQARDAAFLSVRCMILAQTLRRVNMQLLESIRDGSSNPAREHGAVPRVHGEYWGRLHATV